MGLPLLRSLVERTRALLGDDFDRLYAKHTRGQLSDPHRLIVLVMRVQLMTQSWERDGSVTLDETASVTVMELNNVLTLLESARRIPENSRASKRP